MIHLLFFSFYFSIILIKTISACEMDTFFRGGQNGEEGHHNYASSHWQNLPVIDSVHIFDHPRSAARSHVWAGGPHCCSSLSSVHAHAPPVALRLMGVARKAQRVASTRDSSHPLTTTNCSPAVLFFFTPLPLSSLPRLFLCQQTSSSVLKWSSSRTRGGRADTALAGMVQFRAQCLCLFWLTVLEIGACEKSVTVYVKGQNHPTFFVQL